MYQIGTPVELSLKKNFLNYYSAKAVKELLHIKMYIFDFVTIASTENVGQSTFFTEKISEDKNKGN